MSSVDQISGDPLEIDHYVGNKSKSHLKNKNPKVGEDKENKFKVSHKILPVDLGGKNVLGTRCPNTKPAMRKKDQQAIAQLNDKVQEITKHVMGGAPPPKTDVSPSSTYQESMTTSEKEAFMAKYKMKKPFDPNSMLHHMDMFTFRG